VKGEIKMGRTTAARKQLVANLTVGDLREMITEIVRQVVREETRRDYYINEDGVKVLYDEEKVDPEYVRELNEHYVEIASGRAELIDGDQIEKELREMGVPL
jgi:tRNA A37 threonylcarbamoyladenosine dehydratase